MPATSTTERASATPVHASLNEAIARTTRASSAGRSSRRLAIGGDPPRGWVDVLAYRRGRRGHGHRRDEDADHRRRRAPASSRVTTNARRNGPLVGPAGGLERSSRSSSPSTPGRSPMRSGTTRGCYDGRFLGDPATLARWLAAPGSPPPRGPTLVVTDLAQPPNAGAAPIRPVTCAFARPRMSTTPTRRPEAQEEALGGGRAWWRRRRRPVGGSEGWRSCGGRGPGRSACSSGSVAR